MTSPVDARDPFAVRVEFECDKRPVIPHWAWILFEEFGDGCAWCQRCGSFETYARCPNAHCRELAFCEHRETKPPRVDPYIYVIPSGYPG